MSRVFYIYALLLLPFIVISQNNDRWHDGSIKRPVGEVTALICFIETIDNPWTETEKNEALTSVSNACNWLENKALKYDISLVINEYSMNLNNPVVKSYIEGGNGLGTERVDWVYNVLRDLGYRNSKQAYRKLKKKYHCNQLFVLIISKEYGVSYSMRYASGYSNKKYFTEGSIIYKNYHQYAPTPDASISHEILHLCGAWDLYTTYAQTPDRQQKAADLYPNDIMLRVDPYINSLTVDALTAWLIGWNKCEEDIFEWFRPSDFKK